MHHLISKDPAVQLFLCALVLGPLDNKTICSILGDVSIDQCVALKFKYNPGTLGFRFNSGTLLSRICQP